METPAAIPWPVLLFVNLVCLLAAGWLVYFAIAAWHRYETEIAAFVARWARNDYVNPPTDDPPVQTTDEPHSDAVRPSVRPSSDAPSVPDDALSALRSAVQAKNAKGCRAEVARLLVACGATTTLIREVVKGSNDQAGALVDAPPVAPPEKRTIVVRDNGSAPYEVALYDNEDETRYQPLRG